MSTKNYGAILDVEGLQTYFSRVQSSGKVFAFDIESGFDGEPLKDLAKMTFHPRWKLVGFSFTDSTEWARYVPVAHDDGQNVPALAAARLLWNLLRTGRGVPHNAMFELQGVSRWFRETLWDDPFFGAAVRESHGYFPIFSDTMIEANMMQCYQPLGAGGGVGVGLKNLTFHIFGHKMTEFKDLFPEEDTEMGPGTPKKQLNKIRFNTRTVSPKVVEYACEDSAWTLALHELHYPQVGGTLMFRTEIELLNVCARMELHGLELDWVKYEKVLSEVTDFLGEMNEEIQNYFSERLKELISVNLNSPPQVANLLYDKLGLPVQYDPKTKNRTAGEKAIQVLERQDAGVRRIAEYRSVSKLKSSYITKYLDELHYADDGRAHPSHNQLGAGTGRFSVDKVSYQQWPKPYSWKLESGRKMKLNYRNFLIAPEDYRIVGFDFSQVELRILAGMCNETAMLKAFADGVDIHVATAATMLGIPQDQVTKKDRAKGKTLNFAIVYGQGVDALAANLGISIDEAEVLLEQYFEGFPKLRAWIKAREEEGARTWEVSTLFGRRFHIWEYDDSTRLAERAAKMNNETAKSADEKRKLERWARKLRSKADRMCVNAPVQGGAADYMKLGMVRVSRKIREMGWEDKVILVMTIHDALEFYVHKSLDTQTVIDTLNPMVSFPVPNTNLPEIRADWHEGLRWGDVVEIEMDKNRQIVGYAWEDEDGEKHHFDTLEEAYAKVADYNAQQEAEVLASLEFEVESEVVLTVEMDEMPLASDWDRFTDYLADHDDGEVRVRVQIGSEAKFLGYTTRGFPSDLEEMRFILPAANIHLSQLDIVKVEA